MRKHGAHAGTGQPGALPALPAGEVMMAQAALLLTLGLDPSLDGIGFFRALLSVGIALPIIASFTPQARPSHVRPAPAAPRHTDAEAPMPGARVLEQPQRACRMLGDAAPLHAPVGR